MGEGPLDRIHIRQLRLRCIIGVFPEERREKQDVLLSLTLHADLSKPCRSDEIADTVDYKELKKRIVNRVEASEFYLIERLAEEVAGLALDTEGVRQVDVTVDKPGALRFAESVAVEITRIRTT